MLREIREITMAENSVIMKNSIIPMKIGKK